MNRTARATAGQSQRVQRYAGQSDAYSFFNLLTGPELFEQVEAHLPEHRERMFPPTETLSMFLAQVLSADRSCQKAVDEASLKRVLGGLKACSTHTGAYCRARQRLAEPMLSGLSGYAGHWISAHAPEIWLWRGRAVRLVDGTTLKLADTLENQDAYPQPRSQKPGLGFPLCRVVALICLGSGAVLDAALGRYQGKGGDEQTLLRSILDGLKPGEVLLGDAFFPTYFLLCWLHEHRVDGLFEQHGARSRSTDFRRGQRLGVRDHLIVLDKPKKPEWMSQAHYEQAPDTLTVRELRAGGKTLVTTLLCPKQTSKAELQALFSSRWHVELDLRNLKTTLNMHRLSCRTPQMVKKEFWAYLLAYNLIRMMMAQAAARGACLPRQISFKHTVQLCNAWTQRAGADSFIHFDALLVLIAQQRVGDRPGRIEPRAIKQRPKPYPLLTQPRCRARDNVRRHGHPKKLK